MAIGSWCSAEDGAAEVGDARAVAWVAPRSAASTTRACGVEGERGRRAAAGRAGLAGRGDEAGGEQVVDPGGDGRPGQPGELGQLGPGARLAVAQQLEQLPGAGRPGSELEELVHAHSEPPPSVESTFVATMTVTR